jgi:hypothetical protein
VTVAYAALPTLVVQAVRPSETGVANAVNSITRSVGQAAGSALAIALPAAGTDPATGLPRASAFTLVCLIGAGAAAVVALVALVAAVGGRRRPPGEDPLADVERATARAGGRRSAACPGTDTPTGRMERDRPGHRRRRTL